MKKILSAFTLVELLIASAIFLVVILTVYSAFQGGVFGYRNIEENINMYQTARFILERMNLDLRNSFVYSKKDANFTGNKDEISFLALVDTFSQDKIEQAYAFVSYKIEEDRFMRLCRKDKESLKEESEIQPEEIVSNIEEVSFEYGYIDPIDNSLKFKGSWAGKDGPQDEQKILPVAVKIKLSIKNKIKKEFERLVYL